MTGRPAPVEISLVVCTRDRAPYLGACLDAVAAMTNSVAWELVVVDNGSRDETPALLGRFAARAPFPVTVCREPRPGLGRARNAGVAAARGAVLAFTDDDCYPAADFLDAWAVVFRRADIAYGAGRILLYDRADYPITISDVESQVELPPGAYVEPGLVQGANMAFRRAVIDRLGGFDPDLGPGGIFNFEDLDVASRAAAAGFGGGFFPAPTVYHHHRRRAGPGVEALKRSYAHGRGAYYTSLLLRAGARRHGLRAWRDSVRLHAERRTPAELARELAGAGHYATYRLLRALRGDPRATSARG